MAKKHETRRRTSPGQVGRIAVGIAVALSIAIGVWLRRPPPVVLPARPDLLSDAVARLIDQRVAAVRADPSDAEVRGELCLAYEANSMWQEAAECLSQVANAAPQTPWWRLHEASCRRQAGDVEGALAMLKEHAAAHPRLPPIQNLLGRWLLEAGDLEGARSAFAAVVAEGPKLGVGDLGLAEVALETGDAAAAVPRAERAVELLPSLAHAHYVLGRAYQGVGRVSDAERELKLGEGARAGKMADPLTPRLVKYQRSLNDRIRQVEALTEQGRLEEAEAIVLEARAANPRSAAVRHAEAVIAMHRGRPDDALAALLPALEFDTTHVTLVKVATYQMMLGRKAEAFENANRALLLAPADPQANYLRAQGLIALGRHQEALAPMELGAAAAPNPSVHLEHAKLCAKLGKADCSWRALARAAALEPKSLSVRLDWARMALHAGNLEEASRATEEAAALAPADPTVAELRQRIRGAAR